MSNWEGEERSLSTCKMHEELLNKMGKELWGNGKPGLNQRVQNIEQAIYGNKENGQKGMVAKQEEILTFVYSVQPFLNPKLLLILFLLSFLACLKVLGADLVTTALHKFI